MLRALPRAIWGLGAAGSARERTLARAGRTGRFPAAAAGAEPLLRRCPGAAAMSSWLCLLRSTGPLMEISVLFAWGWQRGKVLAQRGGCAPKVRGARAVRAPFLPAGTARKSRTTAVARGLLRNPQPADGSSAALCSAASASIDCSCPGKSDYSAKPWHPVCSAEAAFPSPAWIAGIQGRGMMSLQSDSFSFSLGRVGGALQTQSSSAFPGAVTPPCPRLGVAAGGSHPGTVHRGS